MTYLLDTTAFSDLMLEHPAVDARLAALGEADQIALYLMANLSSA